MDSQVMDILQGAEQALAALSAKAAAERDYARAGRLMALAGGVADLGRQFAGEPVGDGTGGAMPPDRPPMGRGAAEAAPVVSRRAQLPASNVDRDYPRFRREGDDTLVKIGWSKSDRATYEHRSPRDVLDKLAGVIANLGGGGHRFTTDDVLAKGSNELTDVPTYQIYLCLAFIVQRKLLERHGRQGYTIPDPDTFVSAVTEAWAALPKR